MEHAKEMVQDLVLLLIHVLIVVVTVKYDQIRVFLQFNRLALNVTAMEKKLLIPAMIVTVRVKNKHQRKYP